MKTFSPQALGCALVLASGAGAAAQTTNAPAPPTNYSTFSKYVSERNIFNPNRYHQAPNTTYRPRTRTVRRNGFGLAGTMSYDEGEDAGIHAFFDGTSGDYRKVLQPGGTIAVFKIAAITSDSVTLLFETNSTVLKIGQQMRDDGRGHWALSTETISFAATSDSGRRRNYNNGPRTEGTDVVPAENADSSTMEDAGPDAGSDNSDASTPDAAAPSDNNMPEAAPVPGAPVSDALRRLMELRSQEEQSGNRN